MQHFHYEQFRRNFVYNQTFMIEYFKYYNPFVQHRNLTIALLTLLAFYLLIGPVGNIAIIGAIYTNKLLWKPLNIFIVNLCLADLIEVTIITSTSITGLTIGHQVFLQNHRLCNAIANVCVTSCVTSILTHTTIAVTRYWSIRYQSKFLNNATWKCTITFCILIWIAAFLLQMPPDVGWGRNVFDLKAQICIWDRTYSIGYSLYFAIVYVFTPVSIIFYCYVQLYLYVRKIHNSIGNQGGQGLGHPGGLPAQNLSKRRWKQEIKLARTLFAHFALVFTLWGQYAFIVIFDYANRLPLAVHATTIQIAHSIAVLNVFIYLANSSFRAGMIAFITRKPIKLVLAGMGTTAFEDVTQTRKSHVPTTIVKRGSVVDVYEKGTTKGSESNIGSTNLGELKDTEKIVKAIPFEDDIYVGPAPGEK